MYKHWRHEESNIAEFQRLFAAGLIPLRITYRKTGRVRCCWRY